jgi:hypothetical protein
MIDARHFNASRIFSFLDSRAISLNNQQGPSLVAALFVVSGSLSSMEIITVCPYADYNSTTTVSRADTQIPFICRIAALLLLLPFALCIGLDIIAYGGLSYLSVLADQQRSPAHFVFLYCKLGFRGRQAKCPPLAVTVQRDSRMDMQSHVPPTPTMEVVKMV